MCAISKFGQKREKEIPQCWIECWMGFFYRPSSTWEKDAGKCRTGVWSAFPPSFYARRGEKTSNKFSCEKNQISRRKS